MSKTWKLYVKNDGRHGRYHFIGTWTGGPGPAWPERFLRPGVVRRAIVA